MNRSGFLKALSGVMAGGLMFMGKEDTPAIDVTDKSVTIVNGNFYDTLLLEGQAKDVTIRDCVFDLRGSKAEHSIKFEHKSLKPLTFSDFRYDA